MKTAIRKHPIIVMLVSLLFTFILMRNYHLWHFIDNVEMQGIVPRYVNGLVCLAIMYGVLGKECLGWKKNSEREGLKIAVCMLLYAVLVLTDHILQSTMVLKSTWIRLAAYDFILCIGVGLFEEALMRGIVLNGCIKLLPKNKRGLYIAVAISSALFGVAHIVGVFIGSSDNVSQVIIWMIGKVIYTGIGGVVYATIYLKTKNIWICAILHAIYDFILFSGEYWISFAAYKKVLPDELIMKNGLVIGCAVIVCIINIIIVIKVLKKLDPQECVMWKDEIHNPVEEIEDSYDEIEGCHG